MAEHLIVTIIFLAALGSGLMAGLFFAFSVSIMTAFGRLPPAEGIVAMQAINVAIQNPLFFAVFFGTVVVSVVLAVAGAVTLPAAGAAFLLTGSLLYIGGGFLVTVVFNVPLNNRLAAADPEGSDGATVWARYLSHWTAWNHVRTVACIAATAMFIAAL